ncbi:MAG: glycosyltransferase family 4 protein, partial [Gemmatimonadota bacterium]
MTTQLPRVAIFCDDEQWGGIVTYCVMLARGLPEHGIDAVLVAPHAAEWHKEAMAAGVRVVVPPTPSLPRPVVLARTVATRFRGRFRQWYHSLAPAQVRWLIGAWTEFLDVRRELSLIPADLIHVQSAGGEVAALAARHRTPRVPVVTTLHFPPSMVADSRRRTTAWRLLCWLNMRASDATIGVA